MDRPQEILFGQMPRRAATPVQFWVYNEGWFDYARDKAQGRTNFYSTLSWFPDAVTPVDDKISVDFDSPEKGSEWGYEEAMKLKEGKEFRHAVLDPVVEDVNTLAEAAIENDKPLMGIYTGFGVHTHILHQPMELPSRAQRSTINMLESKLNLETVDPVPVGDDQRIMRVPNMERVEAGMGTGIYTVPLSRSELADVTADELIQLSSSKRHEVGLEEDSRPEMEVREDYLPEEGGEASAPTEIDLSVRDVEEGSVKWFVRDLISMPCMAERFTGPNPGHLVRRNTAVMLFNLGLDVQGVHELIRKMDWQDYDPGVTRKQLKSLYSKGYSEMNCESVMRDGMCVKEDPPSCPAYKRRGLSPLWKK